MKHKGRASHGHSHDGSFFIDEIAYASALRRVSPFLKLFVAVYSLILCLASHGYAVSLLILVCMLLFMTVLGKTPWHHVLRLMEIPLAFLLLGSIMVLLQITRSPEGMLLSCSLGSWTLGITGESLRQFGQLLVRCFAAVSCMYFLSTTTPMTELFTALRRMHLPGFLVEIMELVYRYIFVLLEIAGQIRHAQECRLGYGTLKASFYSMGQLISNLFIRAYRQAERTYIAMESRGYTGDVKTLGLAYETKPWQIAGAAVYAVLLGLAVLLCSL